MLEDQIGKAVAIIVHDGDYDGDQQRLRGKLTFFQPKLGVGLKNVFDANDEVIDGEIFVPWEKFVRIEYNSDIVKEELKDLQDSQ